MLNVMPFSNHVIAVREPFICNIWFIHLIDNHAYLLMLHQNEKSQKKALQHYDSIVNHYYCVNEYYVVCFTRLSK